MITTDASKYLPHMVLTHCGWLAVRGHSVRSVLLSRMDLPSKQSVAEKLSIAFFYSASCYLNGIPAKCLARA
jgi:hypothetical protein